MQMVDAMEITMIKWKNTRNVKKLTIAAVFDKTSVYKSEKPVTFIISKETCTEDAFADIVDIIERSSDFRRNWTSVEDLLSGDNDEVRSFTDTSFAHQRPERANGGDDVVMTDRSKKKKKRRCMYLHIFL